MKLKVVILVMVFGLIACTQESNKSEVLPAVNQAASAPKTVVQDIKVTDVEAPKVEAIQIKPVAEPIAVTQKEEPKVETARAKQEVQAVKPIIAPAVTPVEALEKAGIVPDEPTTMAEPVAALGNVVNGKKIAKKCTTCHTFNQGEKKKVGPNLFGVVGRNKGAAEGFKYGSYLKGVGGVWDEVGLRAWVADSKGVAKAAGGKSKMGSQKIVGEKADDLIAYLKTLN